MNMIRIRRYLHGVLGILLLWSFHFHLHFLPWQILLDLDLFGRRKVGMGLAGSALFLFLFFFYPFGMLASLWLQC